MRAVEAARLLVVAERHRVQMKYCQNVLMLSIFYRKRARPLAWHCLPHHGLSRLQQRQTLLDYLQAILPNGKEVIILADREFGSPDRLNSGVKKGWSYAILLEPGTRYRIRKENCIRSISLVP